MKKPLIILTGPTAVGKTQMSIALAKAIGGEIISADSMQVYKYMDIGSAKIKKEEMQGVVHHLIDILEPDVSFNVVQFQALAKKCIKTIYENGKIPIIVGGTGFYIQSILYDIDFEEVETISDYRRVLEQVAVEKGTLFLHQMLAQVDEISAQQIHSNNLKRVIRALEYYKQTGMPISKHNEQERQKESPYEYVYFVLNDHRENLYARINQRVDQMIESGLLAEVKHLISLGYTKDLVSMQGLGYKEIADYFHGKKTLDEAIYEIKRDTRHFAKRQLTWFRREKSVLWVEKEAFHYNDEHILQFMLDQLEKHNIK